MDWNRVEGNWKQVKGKVKEQWGKLTDDDLDVIAGKRDQLEGKIQERYGIEKDRVRTRRRRLVRSPELASGRDSYWWRCSPWAAPLGDPGQDTSCVGSRALGVLQFT